MHTKPMGPLEDGKPPPRGPCPSLANKGQEGPVTRSFMEVLFTSLHNNIQTVKKDLSVDLREVQRNLEEIGDRVSAIEYREAGREGEAREAHPIQFRGHDPVLYKDLVAITLQKRCEFCPVTTLLRQAGISYSCGHPLRIIFRHNGKLVQLRSLFEAYNLLGITNIASIDGQEWPQANKKHKSTRWRSVRGVPAGTKTDHTTMATERQSILQTLAVEAE
ncbi:hypothetical protein NDU88_000904 [Pleurodeles waltl]|uniref:Uncharacterized protein n=1 Tax=Pleurodeles waltl TaxID=8319 RepID=A0AAV7S8W4_PLEWA|nr:hypothetical protein NDU88_000904 [Pleurodeles waltl]